MKLTNELKDQIDNYFDSISVEELYNVLTNKYHLPEDGDIFDEGEFFSWTNPVADVDIIDYSDSNIVLEENEIVNSENIDPNYLEAA